MNTSIIKVLKNEVEKNPTSGLPLIVSHLDKAVS